MRRTFARRIDALEAISRFVSEFVAAQGLTESRKFDIQFVVEEIFTNMVKYDRDGEQEIGVRLQIRGERLEVAVTDFGVEPFDVTRVPEPNLERPLEERGPGGLGLHLVRKLSESLEYRHADGNSTVVVTMRR